MRSRKSSNRRSLEQFTALDALLRERAGLLAVLDRIAVLHGTAQLVRAAVGASSGFVAELTAPDRAIVRWMSGARTEQLRDLVVPLGQGIGGKAMALGTVVRVNDYLASSSITHHFDDEVRDEGLGAMLAIPIVDQRGLEPHTIAIAYAGMHGSAPFGDIAVERMRAVAGQAAAAVRIADAAELTKVDAVYAERRRIQDSLHDSVGAILFAIGAQIQALQDEMADQPGLSSNLRRLESDVSAATSALRESILALEDATPARALPIEIMEHTRSFERRTGVSARFVELSDVPPLDRERTAVLLAVLREGLVNVEKHAKAHAVIVSLGSSDDGVHLAIADDGAGTREAGIPGTRLGLRSLARRAARVGATVQLLGNEDEGCTLRVWLPAVNGPAPGPARRIR
ncbi:GAF domain-containing protein [Amycolatopsis sp. NPDC051371]|uniref:GAF domain-containing sensor histidine kinase n=1 Tax=Amycolatopsis sp. NPDC051371 TaxID=3155800 RepID=UPI0034489606